MEGQNRWVNRGDHSVLVDSEDENLILQVRCEACGAMVYRRKGESLQQALRRHRDESHGLAEDILCAGLSMLS